MFKTLRLLGNAKGFPEWLVVDGKKMQVRSLAINTSPSVLNKPDDTGVRAANKEELQAFVKVFGPFRLLRVHGVDSESKNSMFGPISVLWFTRGKKVEQAEQNLVWGMETGTLILWVKEETKPPAEVV